MAEFRHLSFGAAFPSPLTAFINYRRYQWLLLHRLIALLLLRALRNIAKPASRLNLIMSLIAHRRDRSVIASINMKSPLASRIYWTEPRPIEVSRIMLTMRASTLIHQSGTALFQPQWQRSHYRAWITWPYSCRAYWQFRITRSCCHADSLWSRLAAQFKIEEQKTQIKLMSAMTASLFRSLEGIGIMNFHSIK